MEHELKTDRQVFDDVVAGRKTFEIRFNDRNYRYGDELILRKTKYTGQEMANGKPLEYISESFRVHVTYILHGPIYGLSDDWIIMAITPCDTAAQ